ncbi:second mef2-like protein 1 [Asimina triloba]
MAKSKDDIKYGAAQAKLSEDEMLRVRYKAGTPIEGGKIADSEPVSLFSSAERIAEAQHRNQDTSNDAHCNADTAPTSTSSNDKKP